MKTNFRSESRSRPEKDGTENGEVEKTGREELQQDEEKVKEESDVDGDDEEDGVEEFTRDRLAACCQSIAAGATMNNKLLQIRSTFYTYDT